MTLNLEDVGFSQMQLNSFSYMTSVNGESPFKIQKEKYEQKRGKEKGAKKIKVLLTNWQLDSRHDGNYLISFYIFRYSTQLEMKVSKL